MGADYTYDDYLQSGEVSNPMVAEAPPETNEYTDSLDGGAEYSKSTAKDAGVDLNDAAGGVTDTVGTESTDDNIGKDLNDGGSEQLDSMLDNFKEDNWSDLSLEEQKESISGLADYVAADTGNENPPEVAFREDMADGSYGGYNPETNKIEINVNMLDDSAEAADTIAHEMWHAHQHQCALDPTSEKGQEYQEGFDNYISPEYDFEGYENQMVEAEAREYAQGFKDRLREAA
jgi:predicted SprT family Zn-dependent metalloprotease